MKPTTAIILAAGTGTRLLPVTAAVQKELMPVLNRPVVDYVVSDLVAAGITRIIFVIRPGQTGLKQYFLGDPSLDRALKRLGKTEAITSLQAIRHQAKFEFTEQPEDGGYGTAAGVLAALPLLDGEGPVVVASGDDFVWRADGSSEMTSFVAAFAKSGADSALMATEVDDDAIANYGALETRTAAGGEYLMGIGEKAPVGEAKSKLANISKYIFSRQLIEQVKIVKAASNGELYITAAVTAGSASEDILVYRITGQYLDTGTIENWLKANQIVAQSFSIYSKG